MTATPIQEEVAPDLPPAVKGSDPPWSLSSEATACLHSLQADHPIPIDVFVDALIQTWPQLPPWLQQECLQRAYQQRVERLREGHNQRLAAIEQLLALEP
jgi:acyl carrier protein phosphodiesterase